MEKELDWKRYEEVAVQTVAEGIVMLKNDNKTLPLRNDDVVSVFGRIMFHYYKSGTGSGGMVNVTKVTGILDGLTEENVKINDWLLEKYREWEKEHPYDHGIGWGGEPWSQQEMQLTEEEVREASENSTCAVFVIGRTAGEDKDNTPNRGGYYLSEEEKRMLVLVRKYFRRMAVLLNVGGIIDMEEINEIGPDSILYVWQGGMVGGCGTARVLTGKVSPSGKLPDTIARKVSDYPSDANFGSETRNYYAEDIYVGYRYFETMAKEKVLYPFGFGLSYTEFTKQVTEIRAESERTIICVSVTNTGNFPGKEVVQLYVEAPQGKLGHPSRVLAAFAKTRELQPKESEVLTLSVSEYEYASYDDSGASGHRFCYVCEEGTYRFYLGGDVRSAVPIYERLLTETKVLRELNQQMAPVLPMQRIRPVLCGDAYIKGEEATPLLERNEEEMHRLRIPKEIPYTGNRGILLSDVYSGRNSMDDFIGQLSDHELACLIRGEGMGSPRVTPGTASAFGGVSPELEAYGIPAACCSDGPSGMRMDCGTTAFSLPNGTLIASTFNEPLLEELFSFTGLEMVVNQIDSLLGPGMNIHRHPLNGRNFEYFSEDPFLTGHMAAAELRGLHSAGVTGTIKHFCANNQETKRHYADGVISERALREIYLKGYEIAVSEGKADSIMTTYGPVNGLWTAGRGDLNDAILRGEWNFEGVTMTDWWAMINERNQAPDKENFAAMARARNDLYMVCSKGSENNDNTEKSLADGTLLRCELQRNAKDICGFLLHTHALKRIMGTEDSVTVVNSPENAQSHPGATAVYELGTTAEIDLSDVQTEKGKSHIFTLEVMKQGLYRIELSASSELGALAQMPVSLFSMGTLVGTFTWNGTEGKTVTYSADVYFFSHYSAIRLFFAQGGLNLKKMRLIRIGD